MTVSQRRVRNRPVTAGFHESGIRVFESRHAAQFEMRSTRHRYPELLYFWEGRGHIRLEMPSGQKEYLCVAGDCVIVPANVDHTIEDAAGTPLSLYGLAIDPTKIAVGAELGSLVPSGKLSPPRVALLGIEQRLRRLLFLSNEESPIAKLSAVASAIELFASVARPDNVGAHRVPTGAMCLEIAEYLSWLDRNFFEPVSLDAAADACDFSRRKFTERFKRHTGVTWLNYVQQIRVRHAIKLLEKTNAQVTSIAFRCGFEDLSTFYRVFKRITGKKPLEYRVR